MSASFALQESLVAALNQVEDLTGIFDGPPARAPFPYAIVDAGTEVDWSHKSGIGREVSIALTIWDDQPARLSRLANQVETGMNQLPAPGGWDLITLRFMRKRIVRDVSGPWAAALDYRGRLLANSQGETE